MKKYALLLAITLAALTFESQAKATEHAWTSIVLNVQCQPGDTSSYCAIKKFEYFPDGTFLFNDIERGSISRWMQRNIEKNIDPVSAEELLNGKLICETKENSSTIDESLQVHLRNGNIVTVFTRYKDGRCSLDIDDIALLYPGVVDAAKNRGRIRH
jgi:hypothetical protein